MPGVKNKTLLFLLLMLFACVAAFAQAPEKLFDEAAKAYEAGRYDEAVQKYEKLVHDGYGHGAVLYNLGNAYFKNGNLGKAILNYRRALELLPRDVELNENLEYARALAVDEKSQSTSATLGAFVMDKLRKLSENELALAASALFFLAAVFFCIAIYAGGPSVTRFFKRAGIVLLLLSLAGGAALGYDIYRDRMSPAAVVLDDRVEVKAGPGDSFATVFVLHEGAEITIERSRGEWWKIQFPGAGHGWITEKSAEKI